MRRLRVVLFKERIHELTGESNMGMLWCHCVAYSGQHQCQTNLFSDFQYYEIYVLCFFNYTYMYTIQVTLVVSSVALAGWCLGKVFRYPKGFKTITYPQVVFGTWHLDDVFIHLFHIYTVCFLTLYCFWLLDASC